MGLNGSEREGLGRGLAERERPVQCRGAGKAGRRRKGTRGGPQSKRRSDDPWSVMATSHANPVVRGAGYGGRRDIAGEAKGTARTKSQRGIGGKEAQRGQATCPRSHSSLAEERGAELSLFLITLLMPVNPFLPLSPTPSVRLAPRDT